MSSSLTYESIAYQHVSDTFRPVLSLGPWAVQPRQIAPLRKQFFMTDNQTESQPLFSESGETKISEEKAMTRAAGVVGFWTALSRILGFVRDMATALFLGAGFGADAFFVAFRIPNLLRRLFGEGALSAAFIPTFVETLQHDGKQEAARLARITFTFAALVLCVVAAAGILLSPWIVRLIAPGFLKEPAKYVLTVDLNRIMFPYIFFISLVALASGVLNSLGHFSAPAAAPVVLNLCMIGSLGVMTTYLGMPAYQALAWGVVVAGVLQLALQIPFHGQEPASSSGRISRLGHPALKRIGALFVPGAFSGAVYQINVLLGTILASLLPAGSVSWLYYADRVVELPLGIFAIALGTAVLPSMSRQAANGDMKGLTRSLSYSLRFIAFFTIPASVALIVLREPIVSILFQRGLFTVVDTRETAYALLCYTVGLWAFSGLKVVTQGFFSLKDTRTPMYVSIGRGDREPCRRIDPHEIHGTRRSCIGHIPGSRIQRADALFHPREAPCRELSVDGLYHVASADTGSIFGYGSVSAVGSLFGVVDLGAYRDQRSCALRVCGGRSCDIRPGFVAFQVQGTELHREVDYEEQEISDSFR